MLMHLLSKTDGPNRATVTSRASPGLQMVQAEGWQSLIELGSLQNSQPYRTKAAWVSSVFDLSVYIIYMYVIPTVDIDII